MSTKRRASRGPPRKRGKQRAVGLERDSLFLAAGSDSDSDVPAPRGRQQQQRKQQQQQQQQQRGAAAGRRAPAGRGARARRAVSSDEEEEADEGRGLFGAEDSDSDAAVRRARGASSSDEEDPYAGETPDERRLRMAKELLRRVKAGEDASADELSGEDSEEESDEAETRGVYGREREEDPVAARLRQRVERERGTLSRPFARRLAGADGEVVSLPEARVRVCRGHRLSVTSLAAAEDELAAFTGSKDGSIVRWDVETGRRVATMRGQRHRGGTPDGHDGAVLALAVTSDGNLLASGGKDGLVRVWDARSATLAHAFEGHRGPVLSLAFRRLTGDLYSGSADRTVRVWNAEHGAFVETLFGHQDAVTGLDSMFNHRALSCGADRTVRLWKVETESQLVFEPHTGAMDCAAMLTEERFVGGADDGSLAVWNTRKKRSVCRVPSAHAGKWITSVAALPLSDVIASGSSDGTVRVWSVSDADRLAPLMSAPVAGSVNALKFSKTGRFLLAGVGQEHRLGRWYRVPEGRNGLQVVSLLPPRE